MLFFQASFLGHVLVGGEHFRQLPADAERRVEGLHGVLVDHGDLVAPDAAKLLVGATHQFFSLEANASSHDLAVGPEKIEDAEGDGALAAARFTDDPHGLLFAYGKAHATNRRDVPFAGFVGDGQVFDFQNRRCSGRSA